MEAKSTFSLQKTGGGNFNLNSGNQPEKRSFFDYLPVVLFFSIFLFILIEILYS